MLFALFYFIHLVAVAQKFASWNGQVVVLDNSFVRKELVISNDSIYTNYLKLNNSDLNFCTNQSQEFSFLIDSKSYNGTSGWALINFTAAKDDHQGNGVTINLKGTKELVGIELAVTYLLYPGLPVIRKQISIINKSHKEIMLESLDVDKLIVDFSYVESVVYTNYGRQKHLSTYVGDWDDPILVVHSYQKNAGILLGNEAPGVLKRISYNTSMNDANIGLTHTDDKYPFRKYIRAGDKWASPRTFIIPYINSLDPWQVINTSLATFQRKNMGLRIFEIKNRPSLMYNNYIPFFDKFNDSLLTEVTKATAECGVKQFEIDWGWQTLLTGYKNADYSSTQVGDWIVDKRKFPDGLPSFFKKTSKLGMEPGLWLSIGSAVDSSAVLMKHPEWSIKNKAGKTANIHSYYDIDMKTMCFGTDWKKYIKQQLIDLVKENGLKYLKLDYSVATSAYINEYENAGCYASDHPYHKDRSESFIVIYERLFDLFDELHKELPDLYIDCTFETAGKMQLIDYAFCEHAEGNWLTNIVEDFPVGAFRIRNLAWWKSPVIPASSLIIGDLQINSPDFIQELKTLIGTFPITCGDPRKLSTLKKAEIKVWADWIHRMQKIYNYDLFRQDLPGFGEPVEGNWDGWARINTDTKEGGIIGVFRQGSLDDVRTVSIKGLDRNRIYSIKLAPFNKILFMMTGKALEEKGFKVKMDKNYDGKLFEITSFIKN